LDADKITQSKVFVVIDRTPLNPDTQNTNFMDEYITPPKKRKQKRGKNEKEKTPQHHANLRSPQLLGDTDNLDICFS
jgi:hypothetical protein